MGDDGSLSALLLAIAVPLVVGFGVVSVARWRPRTVAALVCAVVAAGVGVVWSATATANADDPEVGWRWVRVGTLLLACGIPAWALVVIARERKGEWIGPRGASEWGQVLFGYLLLCW